MSDIPPELRDALVRKLEAALDDRDRQIGRLGADAARLQAAAGSLDADVRRLERLAASLQEDADNAAVALATGQRESRERLERLRARADRQRHDLTQALEDARRAQREEWTRVSGDLAALAAAREGREQALRAAGRQAVAQAKQALCGLDEAAIDAMDLGGELLAVRRRVRDAERLATETCAASELLAAATAARDGVSDLVERQHHRAGALAALRTAYQQDAQWLRELATGRPVEDEMHDHTAAIALLLPVERALLDAVIDRHVDAPGRALVRWNGHGAAVARIEAIRDRLAGEILSARRALPAAVAHEERRYALDWLWRDLELRFGNIRDEFGATPGHWGDPADRKSTYRFLLRAAAGEVVVDVPWEGQVRVLFDRRVAMQETPPYEMSNGARWIGQVRRRWMEMAAQMDNPAWNPDAA